MPMNPLQKAMIAMLAGCAPKYSQLAPITPADLWTPMPAHHTTVALDGLAVDVAYMDSWKGYGTRPGADEPPLVLIHGLSSSMGFWEHQLPALANDRRVLALDLPGYGMSGRPDAPYTPPWYSELVVAWLASLDIDNAVLVGHSMGGQIAITTALEHPELVDRLILSAPAGIETFDRGAGDWMKAFWTEERATHASEQDLRATFENLVFNRTDAGVERLLEERVRMAGTEAFAATSVAVSRSIAGMIDHPVAHRLDELGMPTLLVFGTDDRMIPNALFTGGRTAAIAKAGAAAIPDVKLVMLPRAGHTVHHDDPAGFNAAVAEFLAATAPRTPTSLPAAPR